MPTTDPIDAIKNAEAESQQMIASAKKKAETDLKKAETDFAKKLDGAEQELSNEMNDILQDIDKEIKNLKAKSAKDKQAALEALNKIPSDKTKQAVNDVIGRLQ